MENTTGKLLNYYAVESINFPSYMNEIISQVGQTRVWVDVLLVWPAMIFWCGIGKVGVPPATSYTASVTQTIHIHQWLL